MRVGRVGLPVFMISDYRNVGYANTMLRPPAEMYSQVPINSIDGVDAHLAAEFRRHHRDRPSSRSAAAAAANRRRRRQRACTST